LPKLLAPVAKKMVSKQDQDEKEEEEKK